MSDCNFGIRVDPPTSTISSTSDFFIFASSRARSTIDMDLVKIGLHRDSSFAHVNFNSMSSPPSFCPSTLIILSVAKDRICFAFSTFMRSFFLVQRFSVRSLPVLLLYWSRQCLTIRLSISPPPRWDYQLSLWLWYDLTWFSEGKHRTFRHLDQRWTPFSLTLHFSFPYHRRLQQKLARWESSRHSGQPFLLLVMLLTSILR